MDPSVVIVIAAMVLVQAFYAVLEIVNVRHMRRTGRTVASPFVGRIEPKAYTGLVASHMLKAQRNVFTMISSIAFLVLFLLTDALGTLERWTRSIVPAEGWFLSRENVVAILFSAMLLVGMMFIGYLAMMLVYVLLRLRGKKAVKRVSWSPVKSLRVIGLGALLLSIAIVLYRTNILSRSSWWVWAASLYSVWLVQGLFFGGRIMKLLKVSEPLHDDKFLGPIGELCTQLDFPVNAILEVNEETELAHAMATGVGRFARIFIYGKAKAAFTVGQLLATLGHEIGHIKLHHPAKLTSWHCISMSFRLWLFATLMSYEPLYRAFGFEGIGPHSALIMASYLILPLSIILLPITRLLERRFEYQADQFAVIARANSEELTAAFVTQIIQNRDNPNPHPWHLAVYDAHPTIAERVAALA